MVQHDLETYSSEKEGISSKENKEKDEKRNEGEIKQKGNLDVRRSGLSAMLLNTEGDRIMLVNGRDILVQKDKVVPEVLLGIESSRVEKGAQEDADAIMRSPEERIAEIRAENPEDAEEQIHKIEILAAVHLKKEIESIRSDHALTATLSSTFLSFSGIAYRVNQQPAQSGEAMDTWKMGDRFDMPAHAYVIPYQHVMK